MKETIRRFWRNHFQGDVHAVHAFNYILFTIYAFVFLYGIMVDLLQLFLQNIFGINFGGCMGLVVIALVAILLLIKIGLNKLFRLKGRYHALSFVPLFLLMILITICEPRFSVLKAGILGLVLLLYIPFISHLKNSVRKDDDFLTLLIPNLIVFLLLFLFTTFMTNTDDVFHYELKTQRFLNKNNVKSALKVAGKESYTSQRLLALRCYAMARDNSMGEHLFEYPLVPGNTDLFLHETDKEVMIYPLDSVKAFLGYLPIQQSTLEALHRQILQADTLTRTPLADYWLCTLLIKKDLGAFAHWLPRFYDIKQAEQQGNLPRYYREALVLYKTVSLDPQIIFNSNQTEVNFKDFKEMARQYSDKRIRKNYLRRNYGNTYWWHYYYRN